MSSRGVNTASTNAAGRTGQVGYGGTKPCSAKRTANRLATMSRPMSALAMALSGTASRNRSATDSVARVRISDHVVGRQATTVRVRRVVCAQRHQPVRDLVEQQRCSALSVAGLRRRCVFHTWAISVSIWSMAITVGPVSASSREISCTTSCGGFCTGWMPHGVPLPRLQLLHGLQVRVADVLRGRVVGRPEQHERPHGVLAVHADGAVEAAQRVDELVEVRPGQRGAAGHRRRDRLGDPDRARTAGPGRPTAGCPAPRWSRWRPSTTASAALRQNAAPSSRPTRKK